MIETNQTKYILYKGLFWNHPVKILEGDSLIAEQIHLEFEKAMMIKAGTINFLANEDISKHRELVNYFDESLNKKIDFKLNDNPFILADFQAPNNITIENVSDILRITGFGIYQLIKVEHNLESKFIIILSEENAFESESGNLNDYIFDTKLDADLMITKYIVNQIRNHSASFARIKEQESKTSIFTEFMKSLNYFEYFYDYSIIQPTQEVIDNLNTFDNLILQQIKKEIDMILEYKRVDAYKIVKI